jgi:predicted dehydrogenase
VPAERIRLAVAGAGAIGRMHVERIAAEPVTELVGIADAAPAAADVARRCGVPHHADLGALLDALAPDGVVIATPNGLHLEGVLACAERRIHVLVEKPIADTVTAARRMTAAAAAAGIALLVGHHRRYNPIIEKAHEIVAGGRLGRVTAVSAMFVLKKPAEYFDTAWHREPGAGPILINLIHDVDNLRYLCGEIAAVQALTSNAIRGHVVEETAVVLLRFANGALGTATVSDAVPAPWSWEMTSGENPMYPQRPEDCYFICGTEASLSLPKLELWRYDGRAAWDEPLQDTREPVVAESPHVRQLRHFCRVIAGAEAPRIDGADATRTLAVVEAIHDAASGGGVVTIA